VTFGVLPTEPSPDYGYIACGDPLPEGGTTVLRFVEKPDVETARRYLQDGHLWNSGNFVFRAQVLLDEYQAREPDSLRAVLAALDGAVRAGTVVHLAEEAFAQAAKRSIDYAVMERTDRAAVVPARFDWSDIGSWGAVHALSGKDEAGNAAEGGDASFINARNTLVSSDGPHVAVVGVDNLSVIATDDAILVAPLGDTAGVKAAVARLQAARPTLTREHARCVRAWGHDRSLQSGPRHHVKHIALKPGGQLSLQKHHHRAEHWVVISGTARVTIGDRTSIVHENESIDVPIGAIHRLENPGKIELEIIEVQTGSYLGEDDVVRFDEIRDRIAS
jgi:mannose-1-phosphate guanylyltransferase/mannose-6-phosphate isomerase